MAWQHVAEIPSLRWQCGYCGSVVANDKGYRDNQGAAIYICPHCDRPTFIDQSDSQVPDVAPGNEVAHLPEELAALYRESRRCCSIQAYTASVLAIRKMLMNIAVQQGAQKGLKFIEYVEYLASNGFIPPNGQEWVDHIRRKGNEATHEISLMQRHDAEELIAFTEMLLKFIYEFPSRIPTS